MNSRNIPAEWLPHYTYSDYEKWEGDWELIYGIPYAMSPSPKRTHQSTGRRFMRLAEDALIQNSEACDCDVYYELDWIIDDNTVVRPDVMIVCGKFEDDYLRFPPSLIVEVSSKRTWAIDRNVKFKLYENNRVPYCLIIDFERRSTEIFALVDNHYQLTNSTVFFLADGCQIKMDLEKLWS